MHTVTVCSSNKTRCWQALCLLAVAMLMGVLGACGGRAGAAAPGNDHPSAAANAVPAGFVTQTDPAGFVVSYPKSWKTSADRQSGRIDVGGGDAKASILPFYVEQALTPAQLAVVFRQITATLAPGIEWQPPANAGSDVLRGDGAGSGRQAVGLLTWVTAGSATAGTVYVGNAPSADYAQVAPTFAAIFQSFHVQGAPASTAASQPAALSYTTWRDPTQGAFTVEIPKGWNGQGGVVRSGEVTQLRLNVASPDNTIVLYVGDALQYYREPDAATQMAGYRPGQSIQFVQGGYQYQIAAFTPADTYLTDVLLPGRKLTGLRVSSTRDRSDLAGQFPTANGMLHYSAAQVDYEFQRNGQAYRGAALCVLEEVHGPGGGPPSIWHVWRLYLLEAPSARYDEGAAAYVHLSQTYTIDPNWLKSQSQAAAQQAQIWSRMGQQINQVITQGYSTRQAINSQIAERRMKAIRGQIDVTDPQTGTVYRVEDSPNYYWIDKQGNIVGTNANTRPSVDFRPLLVNARQ